MRIAFLAYDRPNYQGGPIVNARRLLPELCRRGHEVHALLIYHQGVPSAPVLQVKGVIVHACPFPQATEDGIDWILRVLARIEPDVFVPNSSVAGWFAARWLQAAGIPTVAAHRSEDAFHAAMAEQFVFDDPVWAVSGLVCVSQGIHDYIAARQPSATRLCVIPSGVPVPEQAATSDAESLRLVFVGRLVQEQKRIFDLIDAFARALNHLPEVSAHLIGTAGPAEEMAVVQHIAGHALGERLQWQGPLEPDALHEALKHYHVLVLLSDYEGTPGAVMDGMACGLVPVCLDIPGGVRELVRHEETGLLVNDRGANFVAAIERLATDTILRQCLAVNARRHIEQNFSLSVAADRWESFLGELIQEAGPRRTIRRPRQYDLPPVLPGLAREDRRRLPWPRRLWRELRLLERRLLR